MMPRFDSAFIVVYLNSLLIFCHSGRKFFSVSLNVQDY